MIKLLRQWAELRPDQCQLAGFNIFTIAGKGICADFTYSQSGTYIYERELVLAWVQFAVQEAIEARGWDYELTKRGDLYHCSIYRTSNSREAIHSGVVDIEAVALLMAYINATEGQRF